MPQTPCLFAPADDRNAPATPTVRGMLGRLVRQQTTARAGDAIWPAGCSGRLMPDATVRPFLKRK